MNALLDAFNAKAIIALKNLHFPTLCISPGSEGRSVGCIVLDGSICSHAAHAVAKACDLAACGAAALAQLCAQLGCSTPGQQLLASNAGEGTASLGGSVQQAGLCCGGLSQSQAGGLEEGANGL